MAFGWLKKIVKPIGSVVKIIPKPIRNLVYETAVPAPIRKIVGKAIKVIPIVKTLIKGDSEMNAIEKILRQLVEFAITVKEKSTVELITALLPMVLDLKSVYDEIAGMGKEEMLEQFRIALDNVIGEEANALIGPAGLLKADIPYVNFEQFSDLLINGAMEALRLKYAAIEG